MERYLEKTEQTQVEVSEMEHLLLGPGHEDVSITSFAENARDEEVTAGTCCSRRLEAKEEVEALRWLVQRVLPRQLRTRETHK